MPIRIIRDDITRVHADAIVNAANNSLLGGGGVDGAIHRAAGPELLKECRALGGCATGKAKITKGYNMPCKYIIHTVGPIWEDGDDFEKNILACCYKECLNLAKEHGCKSIAFPLISAGVYGFPKDVALRIATDTIADFLLTNDLDVSIVIFDKSATIIGDKLYADIKKYIDDKYVDEHLDDGHERLRRLNAMPEERHDKNKAEPKDYTLYSISPLDEKMSHMGETFTEMLLRLIDERGMKDSECYTRANIDRKLFSKIRSNNDYHPSKQTALALAIALKLHIKTARELLYAAGYALTNNSKFDIIVEYNIENGIYDVLKINEMLFEFDQKLLGE